MISISRTWRKFSKQLKTNLHKKMPIKTIESRPNKSHKSVRFNAIDTVYFTHSSTEYDRTPSEESYDLPKYYIPRTVGAGGFELRINKSRKNIPEKYKEDNEWETTTSISVKHSTSNEKQPNIIIEGVIIECNPKEEGGIVSSSNYEIYVGVPWSVYDWILNECASQTGNSIHFKYVTKNREYIWLELLSIPEHTGRKNIRCQVYKNDLKKFVIMGTLVETCNKLESNITGFGQFSIFITKDNYLEFYLTGYQLVNETAIKSFPQPDIEVSPPDSIIQTLNN